MTEEELKNLQPGDIILSLVTSVHYQVTGNYGDHVVAVRAVDVANNLEWELKSKVVERIGFVRNV